MKKLLLLLTLSLLMACGNKDAKTIQLLKNRIKSDSIDLATYDKLNHSLDSENLRLYGDTIRLRFMYDSVMYKYTGIHNDYYLYEQWNIKQKRIDSYEEAILRIQYEIDSIIKEKIHNQ